MKISLIIPAYNEENTILEILLKVQQQNKDDRNLEVIVIDDKSEDNTRKILKENKNLYTKLIELDKNLGKGGAVREGLKYATGDYILFQDADLEYDPREYSKIFQMIENFSAEVIIGSRFLSPEYTRVHYFFHKLGCYLCFKKDLIDPLKLKSNGWSQQAEILATAVKSSKVFYEVPISYSGRTFEEGKKIKARHTLSVIIMIIKKRLF
jgi:glycosyltransferase involved in cell wall biosynthesis